MSTTPRRSGSYLLVLVGVLVALGELAMEASPYWERIVIREREECLTLALIRLQRAVERFTRRMGRPPRDLADVIQLEPRVISRLPLDPVTGDRRWVLLPGGARVASSGESLALDGTRYSRWSARRQGLTWVVDHGEQER